MSPPSQGPETPMTPAGLAMNDSGVAQLEALFNSAQHQFSSYDDADRYINYDAGYGGPLGPVEHKQPTPPPSVTPSPRQGAYQPPSGAAFSSTRRVAGSWRPEFAIPDMDVSPSSQSQWQVQASS
jgi:hypothetical protein